MPVNSKIQWFNQEFEQRISKKKKNKKIMLEK